MTRTPPSNVEAITETAGHYNLRLYVAGQTTKSMTALANLNKELGDLQRCASLYAESLEVYTELSDRRGTAAVITAVGKVCGTAGDFSIGAGGPGQLTQRLKDKLTAIQRGQAADPHGWVMRLG